MVNNSKSHSAGPVLTPAVSNGSFRNRWRDTLADWPRPIARAFTSHLRSIRAKGGSTGSLPPYWVALSSAFGRSRHLRIRTVDDILWATTCLAHALRIEDDLLDGDAVLDVAIFAPALLYVEADHTFARYFAHRSKFWTTYHRLIRSTIEGIALASDAQRGRKKSPRTLARLYMRECDLFTIPLAALCHLSGTLSPLPHLVKAAEHFAVVGQAIDDLVDIEPDLQAGRVNLAALYLLGNQRTTGAAHQELRRHVASKILLSDRLHGFFTFLHRHLADAREAVAPLHLSGVDRYIHSYRSSLLTWEEALQSERSASVVRLLQSR
jgi:hypothetical protein